MGGIAPVLNARATALTVALLAFAGCIQSPGVPSTPFKEDPTARVILSEGAETESGWTRSTQPTSVRSMAGTGSSGAGWRTSEPAARSGLRGWCFSDPATGRYHDSETHVLLSPPIGLPETPTTLRFFFKGDSEGRSGDEFYWEIGSGGQFVRLGSTDGPAADWREVTHDLSSLAGRAVQLRFRFVADDWGYDTPLHLVAGPGEARGYSVDDIEISAA